MEEKHYLLSLDDGRQLDVCTYGKKGDPVILCHDGTPSYPGFFSYQMDEAIRNRVRLITYARPGYGRSTRLEGRSVASVVKDSQWLMDYFDVERFSVLGVSGGGPHALACAALLGHRVNGVSCLSSLAPYVHGIDDFFSGMGEENVTEFSRAMEGEEILQAYIHQDIQNYKNVSLTALLEGMASILCPPDRAVLNGGSGQELTLAMLKALQTGLYGWLDDDLAFVKDWGFSLDAIKVPVQIWHGFEDQMVPFDHGKWLVNHLHDCEDHLLDNEGHLSIFINHGHDIMAWMRTQFWNSGHVLQA